MQFPLEQPKITLYKSKVSKSSNLSKRASSERIRIYHRGMDPVATLTRAQIVEKLFARNLFTKGEAAHIIETLFELMKQSLEAGDDVLISGFGKFCVKDKSGRRGRNPQTGESMMLESRRVVTFKHSGVLREKMNGV